MHRFAILPLTPRGSRETGDGHGVLAAVSESSLIVIQRSCMTRRRSKDRLQLTRAGLLHIAAKSLKELGQPAEPHLSRAGLCPDWAEGDPGALIPLSGYYRFLELVERDVEGFGSVVGSVPVESIGTVGRLIRGAPTVRGALNTVFRFASSFGSAHPARLYDDPREPGVWFHRTGSMASSGGVAQGELLMLRFLIQVVRLAAGTDWKPQALRFRSRAEAARAVARIEAFQGLPTEFGAAWGGFRVPRSVMNLPMPVVHNVHDRDLEAPGSAMQGESFETDLRRLLDSVVRVGGDLSIECVSEMLEVGPRSLQRRLKAEQTTYREIVNDVRHWRSRELILDSDLPFSEIARILGYTDEANFKRAYRRWAGAPPSHLRLASYEEPHHPASPAP